MSFGKDSGSKAAELEAAANQAAVAELRRQFDLTQENVAPFLEAGQRAVPGLEQASTVGGLDQRLREIFNTDIFGSLVGERTRSVNNQLAAGGLTRSGTALLEAARIPTDIGLALEQLLTNRLSNLSGSGQNAALGLGGLGARNAESIAGLLRDTGRARSGGSILDAQAGAKFGTQFGGLIGAGANLIPAIAGVGGLSKFIGGAASLFFSDPNLKENVEEIGTIKDLILYQWDWIEKAKNTIVGACHTMGFMSDEVKEKYPHHVYEFCGFQVIDYPMLLNELESELQLEAA